MSANTATKARLLDLVTGVLELTRDGNRNAGDVCRVLQIIKEDRLFMDKFFSEGQGISSLLADWQDFWSDVGQFDFSSIRVPKMVPGFARAIIVPQGHTLNREYELCKALFPCWRWTEDLDGAVTENEREPKESYLIWVRDREEADVELQNLSANDIRRRKLTTKTLLERMIHERKFFKETGCHLDTKTWTLCSGSRYRDGSVPGVHWSGDGLAVVWYSPDVSRGPLRAREVVRP